jgi:hypothetical protein
MCTLSLLCGMLRFNMIYFFWKGTPVWAYVVDFNKNTLFYYSMAQHHIFRKGICIYTTMYVHTIRIGYAHQAYVKCIKLDLTTKIRCGTLNTTELMSTGKVLVYVVITL